MSQQLTIRPVFPVDRRRLIEAKVARECELMRLEAVSMSALQRPHPRLDPPAVRRSELR